MQSCLNNMIEILASSNKADIKEISSISTYCKPVSFHKDDYLLRSGQTADSIYFLCSGLARFFYITEDGKEHNKSFAIENQFAGALQTSFDPQPSRFNIQALEDIHALKISLKGLNGLYTKSLVWANIGRLYMESMAVRKAEREAGFLLDSAEQRYLDFLSAYGETASRIKLYHIASYLGITDVALSRIRRRQKN